MAATDEDWKRVAKLVDQFHNRPDAEPFRAPVDWKALGLTDYPKIISEPMDLGTVKKKLSQKKYSNLHQVGADVSKIWTNCQEYNREGSDFHKLATSLAKKWDDKFSKVLAECKSSAAASAGSRPSSAAPDGASSSSQFAGETKSAGGDGDSGAAKVTLAERRSFAKSLFSLDKLDLGKLLVDIEAKCPSALTRNSGEDEVEFNVDMIPPAVLVELTQTVASYRKKKTSGSNKRAKTGQSAPKQA